MDGIPTRLFRFATEAGPGEVWAALTRPELTARYLYGLAGASSWRAGTAVTFAGGGATLSGDVLAAEEPHRLSYSLRAGDNQPETYVTWEVVGQDEGSEVQLYVDEPGEPGFETATTSAWLEVVSRLQSVLAGTRR
jgi:uncharacterized protein YndB with AHSA1/START domain